jgi:hypothetical protein
VERYGEGHEGVDKGKRGGVDKGEKFDDKSPKKTP